MSRTERQIIKKHTILCRLNSLAKQTRRRPLFILSHLATTPLRAWKLHCDHIRNGHENTVLGKYWPPVAEMITTIPIALVSLLVLIQWNVHKVSDEQQLPILAVAITRFYMHRGNIIYWHIGGHSAYCQTAAVRSKFMLNYRHFLIHSIGRWKYYWILCGQRHINGSRLLRV